jgi:hypothetical protein
MITADDIARAIKYGFENEDLEAQGEEGKVSASSARVFEETGLLTRDDGVLLKMEDGSEFQITVVQSA